MDLEKTDIHFTLHHGVRGGEFGTLFVPGGYTCSSTLGETLAEAGGLSYPRGQPSHHHSRS